MLTTTTFKSGIYTVEYRPLDESHRAMGNQALLVIRKDDDPKHVPTFSGQVPLEIAQWIEMLVADNQVLGDKFMKSLEARPT